MNLRQLKTFCEIADRGFRITDAAHATHRSQSSVTRQIQLLEKELGCELFARKGSRLLGMTPHGREILEIARRVILETESMRRVGSNAAKSEHGTFTIATTNFQAKYVLPAAVRQFVATHPHVRLSLRQGSPGECRDLVSMGQADLAICAPMDIPDTLVALTCYRLHRVVMTPPRHPLLRVKPLTLEALARYPLITYDEAFSGSGLVHKTFGDAGIKPNIVLSVVDSDVSKIYAGMGMGIAIAASVAFDPKQDAGLRCIDARHLFRPSDVSIILRRHSHLRTFMFDFIELFAPNLERGAIENALFRRSPVSAPRTTVVEL